MPRKKTIIGGQEFTSKDKAKTFVRELLTPLAGQKVAAGSPQWDFLCDLIKRHPEYKEKFGPGIKYFHIGWSEFNKIQLDIEWLNGKMMDVSWVTCVTAKPASPLANLKAALRVAIVPQILATTSTYKMGQICEICSQPISAKADSHVDHDIHFETLVEDFLKHYSELPSSFDDCPTTYRAMFKPADKEFETAWQEFHQANAVLRIVHSKCNLVRSKADR